MTDADFEAALEAVDAAVKEDGTDNDAPPPAKVVGGRFGAPLKDRQPVPEADAVSAESRRNFDKFFGVKRAGARDA